MRTQVLSDSVPTVMQTNPFSKEALIERYPAWADQIQKGDFRIYLASKICVVEWPNTSIFAPSYDELVKVINNEFTNVERAGMKIRAVINSLVVSTVIKRVS